MRWKLTASLHTKWKVPLDNICISKNSTLSFFGPQQLYIVIEAGVKASLVFDLESEKNITVVVKESAQYHGSITEASENVGLLEHTVVLEGEGSSASFAVQLSGSGMCKKDIHLVQHHKAPHTVSVAHVKAVLDDNAVSNYTGLIKIEKDAQHSDAHQENKVLIVSPHAHATSIPSLEVLTNQVQCGHGSAISHLDDEHLFYLAQRGIAYKHAKALLIKAFQI